MKNKKQLDLDLAFDQIESKAVDKTSKEERLRYEYNCQIFYTNLKDLANILNHTSND